MDKVDPVENTEAGKSESARSEMPERASASPSLPSGAREWTIDPRDRARTIRSLKRASHGRYAGLSVLTPEGRYYGIAYTSPSGDQFRDYAGEVYGIRLSNPAILADFGAPVRCESTSLRAVFDPLVDGVVVYAGDQPLVAFAGPGLRAIPPGLLHLSAITGATSAEALHDMLRADPPRELLGLDLSRCEDLADLDPLDVLETLQSLRIQRAAALTSVRGLRHHRRLHTLVLSRCPRLAAIDEVGLLDGLRELRLDSCLSVVDHWPIRRLESLRRLQVTAVPFNPRLLEGHRSLEKLALNRVDLQQQEAEGRVIPLNDLAKLESLNLYYTHWPRSTNELTTLTRLRELDLRGNRRIRSVEPLLRLPELRSLDLDGCENISDVRALTRAGQLRDLSHENAPLAASILAECAITRGDRGHIERHSRAWSDLAKDAPEPDELVQAHARALGICGGEGWVEAAFGALVRAAGARNMHEPTTWRVVLEAARQCGGAAMRKAFEEAVTSRARLATAILALAGVPEADADWARALVERALQQHEGAVLSLEVARAVGWFCIATSRR